VQNNEEVITFRNLRQATSILGVYTEVKAKASSFAQSNAKGLERECADHVEAGQLGAAAAKRTLALLAD
jgi:hypothetical protein